MLAVGFRDVVGVTAEFDSGLSLTPKRIVSISLGSGMLLTTPLSVHKHKTLLGVMLAELEPSSFPARMTLVTKCVYDSMSATFRQRPI